VLYASVAVTGLLGLLAVGAVPAGFPQRLIELAAVVALFAVMGLWVHANRCGLACIGERPGRGAIPARAGGLRRSRAA
jgi:hypothetical protein